MYVQKRDIQYIKVPIPVLWTSCCMGSLFFKKMELVYSVFSACSGFAMYAMEMSNEAVNHIHVLRVAI